MTTRSLLRTTAALLVLSAASYGMSAVAQTSTNDKTANVPPAPASTTAAPAPSGNGPVAKTEAAGKRAWNATKRGTKKAARATKNGVERAADATERGTSRAAGAVRRTGEKIGDKLPPAKGPSTIDGQGMPLDKKG